MKGQQKKSELPAWYRRVAKACTKGNRSSKPSDFDQDLSDLEPGRSNCDFGCICCCDDAVACGCCDGDASDSERSYNGPDAEHYYMLKKEREDRKRQLHENARPSQEEDEEDEREMGARLAKARLYEAMIEEAEIKFAHNAMTEALNKGEKPSVAALGISSQEKTFVLHSVELLKLIKDEATHDDSSEVGTTDLSISTWEEAESDPDRDITRRRDKGFYLQGTLHGAYESFRRYEFDQWIASRPSCPSRRGIKISIKDNMDGGRTGGDINLKFISNDFVIIKVPREVPLHEEGSLISEAALPKYLTLWGRAMRVPEPVKVPKQEKAPKQQGNASKRKRSWPESRGTEGSNRRRNWPDSKRGEGSKRKRNGPDSERGAGSKWKRNGPDSGRGEGPKRKRNRRGSKMAGKPTKE